MEDYLVYTRARIFAFCQYLTSRLLMRRSWILSTSHRRHKLLILMLVADNPTAADFQPTYPTPPLC